jgi:conjugal transfer pilus assembly protein TraF
MASPAASWWARSPTRSRRSFKGTSPIYIDVTTEKPLRPGRLQPPEGAFWQDGVQLPGAAAPAPADHRLRHQLLPRRPAAEVAVMRSARMKRFRTPSRCLWALAAMLGAAPRGPGAGTSRATGPTPGVGGTSTKTRSPRPRRNARLPPRIARRPPSHRPQPQPAKLPEIVEFERLQKTVEDTRNIAIMRPTEANVRRYMELESQVVARASTFADVAQRVAWATPELDPTLQGRPVNAKALEVFEQTRLAQRSESIAELGKRPRAVLLLPLGLPVLPCLRADAGGLPGPPRHPGGGHQRGRRPDAGFPQRAPRQRHRHHPEGPQVPAVYLAQPFTGKITPIGFGVLSESQLLERIAVVSARRPRRCCPPISTSQACPARRRPHEPPRPSPVVATLRRAAGRSCW